MARPPPPSQRGHCRSAPAPRPAATPAHRPPEPSGRRPDPRTERGKFPSSPSPPAAAPRDPRAAHLASPAAVAWAGELPLGQLDSELQLPPPLPAHQARPTARLLSGSPPARRGSVRAHLAGLPSLSGTLRSRTRPRPQPGPDSLPGRERWIAPASE